MHEAVLVPRLEIKMVERTAVITDTKDPDRPPSLRIHEEDPARTIVPAAARLISVPLILIAAAAAVGGVALVRSHASGWLAPAVFVTSAFFLISSVMVPLGISREKGVQKAEKENCQKDCDDLYWALDRIGDRTLKGLAWVNFRQLRIFTLIAQKQARMSYYASLTAAAMSLLVLIAGAAVAIGSPATSAKATAGALATVGAVLSGFLARTFLRAYQMTSLQMSYYYGQPLVHCYLLHAQWLASEAGERLDDAGKIRLREKVIKASLKAAADAQDHLLSMQLSGSKEDGTRPGRHQADSPPEPAPPQSPASHAARSLPSANHQKAQPRQQLPPAPAEGRRGLTVTTARSCRAGGLRGEPSPSRHPVHREPRSQEPGLRSQRTPPVDGPVRGVLKPANRRRGGRPVVSHLAGLLRQRGKDS